MLVRFTDINHVSTYHQTHLTLYIICVHFGNLLHVLLLQFVCPFARLALADKLPFLFSRLSF